MASAQELITRALRRIGVVASGENPTDDENADALAVLNDLIDEWRTMRLVVYETTKVTHTLTSGTAAYTMGPGGTISADRPVWIENVTVLPVTTGTAYERPLHIYSPGEYAAESMKTQTNTDPQKVDIVYGSALVTLTFWPVPSSACGIAVYLPAKPIAEVSSLTKNIAVPPGYRAALRYNLALDLCEEFGVAPTPLLLKRATESLARIQRVNAQHVAVLRCDAALLGRRGVYDINSDSGA